MYIVGELQTIFYLLKKVTHVCKRKLHFIMKHDCNECVRLFCRLKNICVVFYVQVYLLYMKMKNNIE